VITRTWRSPTGHLLLDGQEMTHQQAVHLCLTHTRNEIDHAQTTPTRIVYRTPDGQVCTYEATVPTRSFTSQPSAPPQKRSRS
jgi:hypothetical protein